MRRSRPMLVVGLVMMAVTAAGCGPSEYHALDTQQDLPCGGLPAVPVGDLRLLPENARVTAAVVCRQDVVIRPGSGQWEAITTSQVRADHLPQLVAALTDSDDRPGNGSCTAVMIVIPSFTLTLADGSKLRPGVPGNGCHPKTAVSDTLVPDGTPKQVEYLRFVRSQQAIDAGCDSFASQPGAWLPTRGFPAAPKPTNFSLCRYRTVTAEDKAGPLTAIGKAPAAEVAALWTTAGTTPSSGCQPSGETFAAPPEGWMVIAPTPSTPADGTASEVSESADIVAVVELGGCHRIVGPGLAGVHYADPGLVGRLAALTDPVPEHTEPTR